MTTAEQANVKKTLFEIGAVLTVFIITRALTSLDLGEDDEELWFLVYQTRRLQSELMFYTPVVGTSEAYRILKSPTAVMSTVNKMTRLVRQLGNPTETYKRSSGFNEKGDLKIWARTRDLLPILNNLEKAVNAQEAYKWFSTKY